MKVGAVLRVARPTDHLTAIAEMYAKGLDFTVLAQFEDHEGFDGIILGHPQQPYHLEFTTQLTSRTLFSGSMMVFEEYSLAKRGMVL